MTALGIMNTSINKIQIAIFEINIKRRRAFTQVSQRQFKFLKCCRLFDWPTCLKLLPRCKRLLEIRSVLNEGSRRTSGENQFVHSSSSRVISSTSTKNSTVSSAKFSTWLSFSSVSIPELTLIHQYPRLNLGRTWTLKWRRWYGGGTTTVKRFPDASISSLIPTGCCGRASHHQKLAPTFPWIDSCIMVTKRIFSKWGHYD